MTALRGVLLDLDGVLFDSEIAYRAAFRAALATFGLGIDDATYAGLIGVATPLRAPLLRAIFGAAFPDRAFEAAYRAAKRGALPWVHPRAGAIAAIRAARARGLAVGVATSASSATAHGLLARLPAAFDAVVTRDDAGAAKPSPCIHAMAAAALGCAPADCLAIEDSAAGLRGARAAGCAAVLLPDPALPPSACVRTLADAVLPDFGALTALLSRTTAAAGRSLAMAQTA